MLEIWLICRFLLARFQLDHILSHREPRKRLKAFKTIPKDMPAAYDDVIQRIEKGSGGSDKDLAFRVLAWVFYALRPLTSDEFLEALAVGAEEEDSEDENSETSNEEERGLSCKKRSYDDVRDNMLRLDQLIECCKSLVECEEAGGTVRFVHYTVYEYVGRRLQDKIPTEGYLAKTCLSYLTLHDLAPNRLLTRKEYKRLSKSFLEYAKGFWIQHTKATENDRAVQKVVLTFLASESGIHWLQNQRKLGWRKSRSLAADGGTALHVVAFFGLERITSTGNHKKER